MKFVLNRNKMLVSTLGHTIEFVKGVSTHVPKELWAAAQAIGAVPEDELPEEKVPQSKEPLDPAEREEMILTAMKMLVEENKRESFTGTGLPQVNALTAVMGFKIDNKERDKLWTKLQLAGKPE